MPHPANPITVHASVPHPLDHQHVPIRNRSSRPPIPPAMYPHPYTMTNAHVPSVHPLACVHSDHPAHSHLPLTTHPRVPTPLTTVYVRSPRSPVIVGAATAERHIGTYNILPSVMLLPYIWELRQLPGCWVVRLSYCQIATSTEITPDCWTAILHSIIPIYHIYHMRVTGRETLHVGDGSPIQAIPYGDRGA